VVFRMDDRRGWRHRAAPDKAPVTVLLLHAAPAVPAPRLAPPFHIHLHRSLPCSIRTPISICLCGLSPVFSVPAFAPHYLGGVVSRGFSCPPCCREKHHFILTPSLPSSAICQGRAAWRYRCTTAHLTCHADQPTIKIVPRHLPSSLTSRPTLPSARRRATYRLGYLHHAVLPNTPHALLVTHSAYHACRTTVPATCLPPFLLRALALPACGLRVPLPLACYYLPRLPYLVLPTAPLPAPLHRAA